MAVLYCPSYHLSENGQCCHRLGRNYALKSIKYVQNNLLELKKGMEEGKIERTAREEKQKKKATT
jgi:hypothetical protein